MWARRGEPSHHGPGRTFGGYPYRGSINKLRHPPARVPASDIHGLRLSRHGAAGVPPVDPLGILYVGVYQYHEAARVLIPDMGYRHSIYLGCGCDYELWGVQGCYRMLLYNTGGGLRWISGVPYGDQGAMKAEGQARLEPPRNPGCVSTDYCVCAAGSGLHGVRGGGRLHGGGSTRTTRGPLLLRRMHAALYLGCCVAPIGDALAFCLLLCCCIALPCPFTPGEQTDQRPSLLLMLKLCSCHCPQSPVGRYPRSYGSSVMLWATSGSPGTHRIGQGRNHLSVRDAR